MSEMDAFAAYDPADPNPWLALMLDQSTFFDQKPKEALLSCNNSRSRQILLPLLRPLCRLSIAFIKILKFFLPRNLSSRRLLHRLICFGMHRFVQPEASYLILRHFHIGSQILKFLGDNIDGVTIEGCPLQPHVIDDIFPNMFVQHDLNIYNFIIQANMQLRSSGKRITPRPVGDIDFSAIQDIDGLIEVPPRGGLRCIDLQSAIELYTPMFALLLSDSDFWRASNSLQLDETIGIYLSQMFDRQGILGLINNRHPMVPISTLEAGFRLMIHGLDAENMYGFIKFVRDDIEITRTASAATV